MSIRSHARLTAVVAFATLAAVSLTGCNSSAEPTSSNTVVVWDYYGQSTPLKEAISRFEKKFPEIKVDYQAFDYDTMQEKFAVAVSAGNGPDLATIDMTWVPSYASKGILSDLGSVSGGTLNGQPIDASYSTGALKSMRYDGKMVAALYDFDAYALYYRKDILAAKGLAVPTTWDELVSTSAAMAEDKNGDGKPDKYAFQLLPDSFHYVQLLLQNGGSVLSADKTKAGFNSKAGLGAMEFQKKLLDGGGALYWSTSEGDPSGIAGIQDERIGMFLNGPYMMGILQTGAPALSGKWAIAPAPISKKAGSYLGGTGLVIPTGAKHGDAGWKLAQFLLEPAQQELVYTKAGAAPATLKGLASPAVSLPNPYFGGEKPFRIFADALASATPFPYVAAWSDIDTALTDASTSVMIGKSTPSQALTAAEKTANAALKH
jgi:multiple sugar transport system substrate-binding protein